jgi:hypothetical protein
VNMQQVRTKTPNRAIQQPGKTGTDRRIQKLAMTCREGNVDIGHDLRPARVRSRLGMRQHGRVDATFGQCRAQIGASALDPARMRREEFTEMENAHRSRISAVRRPVADRSALPRAPFRVLR